MSFPKPYPVQPKPIVVYIGERRYEVLEFNPARREARLLTQYNFTLIAPFSALTVKPEDMPR